MKYLRIKELLCVLVLVAFIFAVLAQKEQVSDAKAVDVGTAVTAACGLETLTPRGDKAFKKEFGLDPAQFDGGYYISSDDVMEVREVLVIRLKPGEDGAPLLEALRRRAQQKTDLFEGYAAEQTALLKNYKLVRRGNFVLFAVCDVPSAAEKAFRSAL